MRLGTFLVLVIAAVYVGVGFKLIPGSSFFWYALIAAINFSALVNYTQGKSIRGVYSIGEPVTKEEPQSKFGRHLAALSHVAILVASVVGMLRNH